VLVVAVPMHYGTVVVVDLVILYTPLKHLKTDLFRQS